MHAELSPEKQSELVFWLHPFIFRAIPRVVARQSKKQGKVKEGGKKEEKIEGKEKRNVR